MSSNKFQRDNQAIGIGVPNPLGVLHLVKGGEECFILQEDGTFSGDVAAAIDACSGESGRMYLPYLRAIQQAQAELDEARDAAKWWIDRAHRVINKLEAERDEAREYLRTVQEIVPELRTQYPWVKEDE